MKPLRITYVITDLQTGGVPLHLLRLAVAIRRRGYRPNVISLAPPGPVTEQFRSEGICTNDCNAAGPTDVGVFWRLARHLRRVEPDLVHSFLFHANVACRVAVPLAGRSYSRLICELQTAEIERKWHLTVGGMLHRFGACVVGNSPSVVAHLRREAHMAAGRLRCIVGGVDVRAINSASPALRTAWDLPAGVPVVLWVGRLDPVKGLDELTSAFALVTEKVNARLLIVGDGDYADHVRDDINRRGLGDRVCMLGRRGDVANLLQLADLFVFPSRTEGMPNALLEAMAAGKPIVTTDVPGCRDLIDHEHTGLIVPPRNAQALAAGMTRLFADPTLADRLGASAALHAERHYTFGSCVDRYEALYHETLFGVT